MEGVKGWEEESCFRKNQEHSGENNAVWLAIKPGFGGECEIPGWRDPQGLYLSGIESLVRQRAMGSTEEEKEYDLCFRKATMAAMGKEFVRGTAWRLAGRPGRRLMQ